MLVFLVPKVGGAADLAIKIPHPQTQEWYITSANHTVDRLNETLRKLRGDETDPISLTNIDLDTGKEERAGDYPLADQTYARLLEQITRNPEQPIRPDLQQHILAYYGNSTKQGEAIVERLSLIEKMQPRRDH